MTDAEITRKCAEAMGLSDIRPMCHVCDAMIQYEPLHDDAQAMALVKKLNLNIIKSDDEWWVHESPHICDYYDATDYGVYDKDLCRAICECVAKMGEAK